MDYNYLIFKKKKGQRWNFQMQEILCQPFKFNFIICLYLYGCSQALWTSSDCGVYEYLVPASGGSPISLNLAWREHLILCDGGTGCRMQRSCSLIVLWGWGVKNNCQHYCKNLRNTADCFLFVLFLLGFPWENENLT